MVDIGLADRSAQTRSAVDQRRTVLEGGVVEQLVLRNAAQHRLVQLQLVDALKRHVSFSGRQLQPVPAALRRRLASAL